MSETSLSPLHLGSPLANILPSNISNTVTFSVKSKNRVFGIESHSGQLYLRKSVLDYETKTIYNLEVVVRLDKFSLTIYEVVKVDDVIDEPPHFENNMYRVSLSKNLPVGSKILTFTILDLDDNDVHKVNILTGLKGSDDKFFRIDPSTNSLVLSRSLEGFQVKELVIVVTDLSGLNDTALVLISVYKFASTLDKTLLPFHKRFARQVESNRSDESADKAARILLFHVDGSQYLTTPFSAFLDENTPPGSQLLSLELEFLRETDSGTEERTLDVHDLFNSGDGSGISRCPGDFNLILFSIEEENVPFQVTKNFTSCKFTLVNTEHMDYENPNTSFMYSINIQAMYRDILLQYRVHIGIFLQDINDNAPFFPQSSYSVTFKENFVGIVTQIQAQDADISSNFSKPVYSISGDISDFSVEEDGSIQVLRAFDYELENICYYFNISAQDGGFAAIAQVEACLVDTNDNCPKFEQEEYSFEINEDNTENFVLLYLLAVDADSSLDFRSGITYTIEPISATTFFELNTVDKVLSIRTPLDYDAGQQFFFFSVLSSDSAGETCTTNISVTVLNVRDISPTFGFSFSQHRVSEELFPYQSSRYPDNIITCFLATDEEGDNITYSLKYVSSFFNLTTVPSESGVCLMLLQPLDYELTERYEIEITASDGTLVSEPIFIVVDVVNLNDLDFKVQEEYFVQVKEEFRDPYPILNITVNDPKYNTTYFFDLETESDLFSVSATGSIQMQASLDYESQVSHSITVRITDGTNVLLSQVEIQVIPVNEYPPVFPPLRDIRLILEENSNSGTLQYYPIILDDDTGSTDLVQYELVYITINDSPYVNEYNSSTAPFAIVQPTEVIPQGKVTNVIEFDYEEHPTKYVMHIYASDGMFRSSAPLVLTISIEDVNEFAPQFDEETYTFMIPEDQDNIELELTATDLDGSIKYNLVASYSITFTYPPDIISPFFTSGNVIQNTRRFNFEEPPNLYWLVYTASDNYGRTGSTNVTIMIQDANEFAPVFDYGIYQFTIPETLNVNSLVLLVNANDNDGGPVFGSVVYSIQSSGTAVDDLAFGVNNQTGNITLVKPVDFDIGQEGEDFYIVASDGGGLFSRTHIFISIEDINDNPPCPLIRRFGAHIVENIPRFSPLRRFQVYDVDYDAFNPPTVFYMEPAYDPFMIDETGRLYLTETLDYEEKKVYMFNVITSDGIQNCSIHTMVRIDVINLDDNRPEFSQVDHVYNITETIQLAVLFNITAFDADAPDRIVEYRLQSSSALLPFSISNRGVVSNTREIDADDPAQPDTYSFEAVAFNQFGVSTSSHARITINIIDINDNVPVFEGSEYFVGVFENQVFNSTPVLTVRAIDNDRTANIVYRLHAQDSDADILPYISVGSATGEVFVSDRLDYESLEKQNYSLSVSAMDGVFNSSSILVFEIFDVNEFAPTFMQELYHIFISLQTNMNSLVYNFVAVDRDGSEALGMVAYYELIRSSTPTQGQFPFELHLNGTLTTTIHSINFLEFQYSFSIIAYDSANMSSHPVNVTVEVKDFAIDLLPKTHCIQVMENVVPVDALLDLSSYEGQTQGLYSYNLVNNERFLSLQGSRLFLISTLDFEDRQNHAIVVRARNGLGNTVDITLFLCVQNINDNPTNFLVTEQFLTLTDDTGIGAQLYMDIGDLDQIIPNLPSNCCMSEEYRITNVNFTLSSPRVPFRVNFFSNQTHSLAVISNTIGVDQMASCLYVFLVTIVDSDGMSSNQPLILNVQVKRQAVGSPTFTQLAYTFITPENSLSQFEVHAEHIPELNACIDPTLSGLQYSIAGSETPFVIDVNGRITMANLQTLDLENSQERFNFEVVASNQAGYSSRVPVAVYLQDVNEFCPKFHHSLYEVHISEGTGLGEIVLENLASDNDSSTKYGMVIFFIDKIHNFVPFEISNGSMYLSEGLDYERDSIHFDFNVSITDGSFNDTNLLGRRCDSSNATIVVTVLDTNDEIPYFERTLLSFSVHENTSNGSVIGELKFSDPDQVDNIFQLDVEPADVPFAVSPNGDLFLTRILDFEQMAHRRFNFLVYLTDGLHNAPAAVNVTVNLLNINEFRPVFFQQEYSVSLLENLIPQDGLVTVTAMDKDGGFFGEIVRFELKGSSSHLFDIDNNGLLRNIQEFDYETDPNEFNVMVVAYDGGGKNSSVLVSVALQDENDHVPEFDAVRYVANVSEAATAANVTLLSVHAVDRDRSLIFSMVSYSLLNSSMCTSSFRIDSVQGSVQVITPIDFEAGVAICELEVSASDPQSLQDTSSVYIHILDSNEFKPVITSEGGFLDVIIHEAVLAGELAHTFDAHDDDGGEKYGSIVEFEIIPVTMDPLPFFINELGELNLTRKLSRYSSYSFEILARDGGGLESEKVHVTLNVTEANFFVPEVTTLPRELLLVITENEKPSLPLWYLNATDQDANDIEFLLVAGPRGILRFELIPTFTREYSGVNVWLDRGLDFEERESYRFEIAVYDGFHTSLPVVLNLHLSPVNEHRPLFGKTHGEIEMLENTPPYTYQILVKATDLDRDITGVNQTKHGVIENFHIVAGSSFFAIINQTDNGEAVITNTRSLDYEASESDIDLIVQVVDGGGLMALEPKRYQIHLIDVNDNAPEFLLSGIKTDLYLAYIPENYVGEAVKVMAIDRDISHIFGNITYRLSDDASGFFIIDSKSGVIYIESQIDFELSESVYNFTVIAEDIPGMSGVATVSIIILDENEFAPELESNVINIAITENTPAHFVIYTFEAFDADGSEMFGTVSKFEANNLPNSFSLDVTTGDLRVNYNLDYEVHDRKYNFTIKVFDRGDLSSSAEVTIIVSDMNEYPPVYQPLLYSVYIDENTLPDPLLGAPEGALLRLSYTDRDGDSVNSYPTFTLKNSSSQHFFFTSEGYMILNSPLDYEEASSYTLMVVASDGNLTSPDPAIITVNVLNLNDNPPSFTRNEYYGCIMENVLRRDPVSHIEVQDLDQSSSFIFNLIPQLPYMRINSMGEVFVETALDFETIQSLHFTVSVSDGNFTSEMSTRLTMYVIGVNDVHPTFNSLEQELNVSESMETGSKIVLPSLYATDMDLNNIYFDECVPNNALDPGNTTNILESENNKTLSYRVLERNSPFSVAFNEGDGHLYIELLDELDYELHQHEYRVTLVAFDGELDSLLHARVYIHLLNVDDSAPIFDQNYYVWSIFENLESFSAKITATDPDGFGNVTFSIRNQSEGNIHFTIDEQNGNISSSGPFDFERYPIPINFTVSAMDSAGHSSTVTASFLLIDMNDNKPTFDKNFYTFEVPESVQPNEIAFEIRATDLDKSDRYGTVVVYYIIKQVEDQFLDLPFTVDNQGSFIVNSELDYEAGVRVFNFDLVAVDSGNLTSDSVPVLVHIIDTPDTAPCPRKLLYEASVQENLDVVLHLFRIRFNVGLNLSDLSYTFTPNRNEFEVNAFGDLIIVESLDYEVEQVVVFNLTVSNQFQTCSIPSLVRIRVLNRNDQPPMFPYDLLEVSIEENVSPGYNIAYLNHTDLDGDRFFDAIYYNIIPENAPFRVVAGFLQNVIVFDAETQSSYTLQVVAVEATNLANLESNVLTILVTVADENDFVPLPDRSIYRSSIKEGAENGSFLVRVSATDRDVSYNYSRVTFGIDGDEVPISIDPYTGNMFVNGIIDYEAVDRYDLVVIVVDGGGLEGSMKVTVTVLDVNEHAPVFEVEVYTIDIIENTNLGTDVFSLSSLVSDADGGPRYGRIVNFTLISPELKSSVPVIITSSGRVRTANFVLDFESGPSKYYIQVQAEDGGGLISDAINITLVVRNGNDAPTEIQPFITIEVPETTPQFSLISNLSVYVTDPDDGASALEFIGVGGSQEFLVTEDGLVYLEGTLDRNVVSTYFFYLTIYDGRFYSPYSFVIIEIVAGNVHRPYFPDLQYNVTIRENSPPGTLNLRLVARDNDSLGHSSESIPLSGKVVSYSFSLAPVQTNPFNLTTFSDVGYAVLTNQESLDYEVQCIYNLTITAMDGGGLTSIQPVVVNVEIEDVNEFPAIFSQKEFIIELFENSPIDFTFPFSDKDREGTCRDSGNSSLRFEINQTFASTTEFFITANAAGILYSNTSLDFETNDRSYLFLVELHDGSHVSVANLTVNLLDKNEYSPVFLDGEYSTAVNESTAIGTVLLVLSAYDLDGGPTYGNVTNYTIISTNQSPLPFAVHSDGSIELIAHLDYELQRRFQFSVTAVDGGGRQAVASTNVEVAVLNTNDLPPNFVHAEYLFNVTEIHVTNYSSSRLPLFVGKLEAEDPDKLGQLTFVIFPVRDIPFIIDSHGNIYMDQHPDFEEQDYFNFSVAVSDGLHQSLQSSSVVVKVINLNEYAPFFNGTVEVSLPENTIQGEGWLQVMATDEDRGEYGYLFYRLIGADGLFEIDSKGNIVNLNAFDYEGGQRLFTFIAEAEDRGGLTVAVTVTVMVTDQNEYTPRFEGDNYNATVAENFVGEVLTVTAIDGDGGDIYGDITYRLHHNYSMFDINYSTGEIGVTDPLDFEKDSLEIVLIVVARDGGNFESEVNVLLYISDVNEYAPYFDEISYSTCISRSTGIGESVFTLSATDSDGSFLYGTVEEFSLLPTDSPIPFTISDDQIIVIGSLYQYSASTFDFEVIAIDGGLMSSQPVAVSVCFLDEDSSPPTFIVLKYDAVVTEGVLPSEPLAHLQAVNTNNDTSFEIMFILLAYDDLFTIDSEGYLRLIEILDFEEYVEVIVEIAAFDGSLYSSQNATLNVFVYPLNEHRPYFSETSYTVSITENSINDELLLAVATDRDDDPPMMLLEDLGYHGQIENIYFYSGNHTFFELSYDQGSQTAVLSNTRPFDFDDGDIQFTFYLIAVDGGSLSSNPLEVTINVIDINDEIPRFSQSYNFTVHENYQGYIGMITAKDADKNVMYNTITYSLIQTNERFVIQRNGSLLLIQPFDYESDQVIVEMEVYVRASDAGGLNSTTIVSITITDLNEFAPEIIGVPKTLLLPENSPIGTTLINVTVTDEDGGRFGELLSPVLEGIPSFLGFFDGISLRIVGAIDYESLADPSFDITVSICDKGGLCATNEMEVRVTDVNEFPPEFSPKEYSIFIEENTISGEVPSHLPSNALLKLNVSDLDYDSSFTFSILSDTSDSFSVSHDGYLLLNSSFDYEAQIFQYVITVGVTDGVYTAIDSATIIVNIINVNDNPPSIRTLPGPVQPVNENSIPPFAVYYFLADDADRRLTSLTFHFWNGSNAIDTYHNDSFRLDSNGALYLTKELDYEVHQELSISVVVFDGDFFSEPLEIVISIIGVNDNAPEFEFKDILRAHILENLPPGTLQLTVLAVDADRPHQFDPFPVNQVVHYNLISAQSSDLSLIPFSITINQNGSGIITNDIAFDYEQIQRVYRFGVTAFDIAGMETTIPLQVEINILDSNDHTPEFAQSSYTARLPENSLAINLTVLAQDIDSSEEFSKVTYSIFPESDGFSIDQLGRIQAHQSYDYEAGVHDIYFMIFATDIGNLSSVANVHIILIDQNDNIPIFGQASYFIALLESTEVDSIVLRVEATDSDSSTKYGSIYRYLVIDASNNTSFAIDPITGDINLTFPLDYETGQVSFALTVRAIDFPGPQGSFGETSVIINITNVNDNSPCPLEANFTFYVDENVVPSEPIGVIEATDLDDQFLKMFEYVLVGSNSSSFSISSTGDLYLVEQQNAEDVRFLVLNVQVSDGSNSCPYLAEVNVIVVDLNDNAPVIYPSFYIFYVTENEPELLLGSLSATDNDYSDDFSSIASFSIIATQAVPFEVTREGKLKALRSLDAESDPPVFQYQVVALDYPGLSSIPVNVTVYVENINDHQPQFDQSRYYFTIEEGSMPGDVIGGVTSTDGDIDMFGEVTYSLAESNGLPFSVDPLNGNIILMSTLGFEGRESNFTLTIVATDGGGLFDTVLVRVDVIFADTFVPQIEQMHYSVCVREGTPAGTQVLTVRLKNQRNNSSVMFETFDTSNVPFMVNSNGTITTSDYPTDYENGMTTYVFQVVAIDERGRMSNLSTVEICVLNINDNSPYFEKNTTTLTLEENYSGFVTDLVAIDPDQLSIPLTYEIIGDLQSFILFQNGTLYLEQFLDYEQQSTVLLQVVANDSEFLSNIFTINIQVMNINDNAPIFTNTIFHVELLENEPSNTILTFLQATDEDYPQDSSLQFSAPSFGLVMRYEVVESEVPFTISYDPQTNSGILINTKPIDFEVDPCTFELTVFAYDGGGMMSNRPAIVQIQILNANDNAVSFKNSSHLFELLENYVGSIGKLIIEDPDFSSDMQCHSSQSASLPNVTFHLFGQNVADNIFIIDETGLVSNLIPLDYEAQIHTEFDFVVSVFDGYNNAIASLTILLLDEDESCLTFHSSLVSISISESSAPGDVVYNFLDIDAGLTQDGSLAMFELVDSSLSLPFSITMDGQVVLSTEVDYENVTLYSFYIRMFDDGTICNGTTVVMEIQITNENDELPYFLHSEYTFLALESLSPLSIIGEIQASDPDDSILNLHFLVDTDRTPFVISSNGEIILVRSLDYEVNKMFHFGVIAFDGVHMSSGSAQITVIIQNVNEHSPEFLGPFIFFLPENKIGSFRVNVIDRDSGDFGEVKRFSIEGQSGNAFVIDDQGFLNNSFIFDFDNVSEIIQQLTVCAHNVDETKSCEVFYVNLQDVNDNAPVFSQDTYMFEVIEGSNANHSLKVTAIDMDRTLVFSEVRYSWDSHSSSLALQYQFIVNQVTGVVILLMPLDYESGLTQFNLTMQAFNNDGLGSYASIIISVVDVNEFPPLFPHSSYNISVDENIPLFVPFFTIEAFDEDGGELFGIIHGYHMSGNQNSPITIGSNGSLMATQRLDFESGLVRLTFNLVAVDGGGLISEPVPVTVHILDVQDTAPTFEISKYSVSIRENADPNSINPIADLQMTADSAGVLSYIVTPIKRCSRFEVTDAGLVNVLASFDYEVEQEINCEISAFDGQLYSPFPAILNITLSPENDHSPIFIAKNLVASLYENTLTNFLELIVQASDADIDGPETRHGVISEYRLLTDSVPFRIMHMSFGIAVLTNTRPLDAEIDLKSYNLSIQVFDGLGKPALEPAIAIINILDVDDNVLSFTQSDYTFSLPENLAGLIGIVEAVDLDRDADMDSIKYVIEGERSADFMVFSNNGSLFNIVPFDFEVEDDDFIFTVTTEGCVELTKCSANLTLFLQDVNEFPPEFTSTLYYFTIADNLFPSLGLLIGNIHTTDKDRGHDFGHVVNYALRGDAGPFSLDVVSGNITVSDPVKLSVNGEEVVSFEVTAVDGGGLSSTAQVDITIPNFNLYPPIFEQRSIIEHGRRISFISDYLVFPSMLSCWLKLEI